MKRKPKGGFGDNGFELWGGYMSAKKAKLQEQFLLTAAHQKPSTETDKGIFHGIAIFVNGYTEPSADQLKRIMMLHGGLYHHYMTDRTTHIIATNLPDVKIKKLKIMRVVKPEWISDSVQAGKLLDYRLYLLYSHQSKTQPRLQFVPSNSFDINSPAIDKTSTTDGCQKVPQSSHSSTGSPSSTSAAVVNDAVLCKSDSNVIFANQCSLKPSSTPVGEKDVASSLPGNVSSDLSLPSCSKSNQAVELSILKTQTAANPAESMKSSSPQKVPISTAKTAGEANFLSEFYNNSRLHHISTMGATFKQYVNELREKANHKFEGQDELREWKKRREMGSVEELGEKMEYQLEFRNNSTLSDDKVIMHIDMDCFFVSVGLRNRPELRGQPVAVTHAKGNQKPQPRVGIDRKIEFDCYKKRLQEKTNVLRPGNEEGREISSRIDGLDDNSSMAEIASCSYEARKMGIKNGMFVGQALKLCPNLKTIAYDFDGYKEVSYSLYNTVARYTLDIEAVSCDELFVDCTTLLKNTEVGPLEFAAFIRKEIKDQTGCPASTGFGANLLQARLATKRAKPDGQFHLLPHQVDSFMRDIKVEDLPGVGRSMSYKLQGLSVESCGDLQQHPLFELQREFGVKTGEALYRHCRGQDERKLSFGHVRKSVSAEVNYGIRFSTQSEADAFFRQLAAEVTTRLKEVNMKARCITLKLMVRAKDAPTETAKYLGHGVCDHITKSTSLARAVADAEAITREVLSIQRQLRVSPSELRGIGIQLSRLENCTKTSSVLQNFLLKKSTCTNSTKDLPKELDVLVAESNKIKERAKMGNFKKLDNFLVKTTKHTSQPTDVEAAASMENSVPPKLCEGSQHLNKQDNLVESNHRFTIAQSGEVNQKRATQGQVNEGDIDPEVFAALPNEIQDEILQQMKSRNTKLERRVTRGMSQPSDASQLTNNSEQKSQDLKTRKLLELGQSNMKTQELVISHPESQEPGPSRRKGSQERAPPSNVKTKEHVINNSESQEPGPSRQKGSQERALPSNVKTKEHVINNSESHEPGPSRRKGSQERAPPSNVKTQEHVIRNSESQEPGPSRQKGSKEKTVQFRETTENYEYATSNNPESGSSGQARGYSGQDVIPMDQINYSQIEPSFLAALPDNVRKELETDLLKQKADRSKSRKQHSEFLDKNILNQEISVRERLQLNIDVKGKGPRRKKQSKNAPLPHEPTVTKNTTNPIPVNNVKSECVIDPDLTVPETRTLLKAWVSTESVPQPCDVDMLARHFQQLAATRKLESLDLVLKCFHRCVSHKKSRDWEEAFKNIIHRTQNTMQIVYGAELHTPNAFAF